MSKKLIILSIICICYYASQAQIEVAKIIGKNSEKYGLGYSAFIKFSYPITDADDISLEYGATVFMEKGSSTRGLLYAPLKLGYRYTLNRTGRGFYVEPQLGFNTIGAYTTYDQGTNIDKKINGFVGGVTAGYLFQPLGNINFDIGLRFETVKFEGGSANAISLKLAHYFNIGRKREE